MRVYDNTMASNNSIIKRPPGQERPSSAPSSSGRISFTPPGTDLQCETSYRIWGSLSDTTNDKPPLICLHGGPGATSVYMTPLSLLHVDYNIPVIIYDQLGCGQSTRLRSKKGDTIFWTVDLFVAELQNLLTALKVQTFDLLGHSWGGQLAARFAADHEQSSDQLARLRKLIILNSTAYIALRTPYFESQMRALPPPHGEIATQALQSGNTSTPEYAAALTAHAQTHMCRLSPWPSEMLDCVAAMEEDDTVSSTMEVPLTEFNLRPDLKRLDGERVPGGILVVSSKFDSSVEEVVEPFFALPRARVKWVRLALSGHMSVLEETEEVVRIVGSFLGMDVDG